MLILVVLSTFGFAFTMTLWLAGFSTASGDTVARLGRLSGAEAPRTEKGPATPGLRRRATISLAGINLVSSNLASRWGVDLERAGLTINAREYFMMRLSVALILGAFGYLLVPIPMLGLLAAPLGYFLVGVWLQRRINSRLHKLEAQLIELLQMIASGLRAGFGLIQSFEAATDQLPVPLSTEIRRMLRDTAMGASIDQALVSMNERVGSSDFDIVITAILIQRQVGGNLAEILDNVAHTMRERERIRGEIRALTSQQRMTGYVIGGIPVGLALIFFVMSPSFITPLFTEKVGRIMLGIGAGLETVGFLVIRKIVNIEV